MTRPFIRSALHGALLLPALLWPAMISAADFYKWTDADGKVHFSQTPPDHLQTPANNVEKGSVHAAPTDEAAIKAREKSVEDMEKRRTDRLDAAAEAKQQEQQLAAKEKECGAIRKQLDLLGTGRRLRGEESGRIIPAEELEARRKTLQKRYTDHCG